MTVRRTRTVLLVDDDAAWRVIVERWLKSEGMRTVGLARGEWVINAIETYRPDVVILDVHLPSLNGLDVLRLVRGRCPGLPVVVMTAFGGQDIERLARDGGAAAYLEKPFRMARLAAELSRIIGDAQPPGCSASR